MDTPTHSQRKQKKPSFFKVLMKDFFSQLQIPPTFIKYFGKNVPNRTTLHEAYNNHDKSWEVEVGKLEKKYYFRKGWREFAEDNNLEHGDFLTFKYSPHYSKFKVTIYGITGCLKQLNVPRSERCSELLNVREEQRNIQDRGKRKRLEVEDDVNEHEELKGGRRRRREFDRAKVYERDVIRIDSYSSDEDQTGDLQQSTCRKRRKGHKALGNISSSNEQIEFKSQYPFFQARLKFSNISGGYLHIPTNFYREHMMNKNKEIKLQISNKIWPVGLQVIPRHGRNIREARLSQGWRAFMRQNDLQIDDVCIFEMNSNGDFVVFNVHIYRWDIQKAEFVQIFPSPKPQLVLQHY